ncbi:SNARE_assoc domain-containing protein [Cephalotus follicularis]|uniref:SNARE_assoc domain-containing protein n=1 Tax=Cephalotus follicularis TaxID=3775 RepID=A0A1Q3DBT3_CEPFO|nr:SNARE_assoc domain-containing protein [Cephalotus follicularis]
MHAIACQCCLAIETKKKGEMGKWWKIGVVVGMIGIMREISKQYGWEFDKEFALKVLGEWSDRLGIWAIPVYVGIHTLTLALCLPYAVFFEAGASLLFGFFPAVLCVFFAKILAASLSFWIGRLVFRCSTAAMALVQGNNYFHLLSKGVECDGWKFVLLARFSPIPSYVINYALAATNIRFIVDFLLPTIIGCVPMILQNTSIGSLAGAAVASASGSQKSQIWSYLFPLLGIVSSVLISLRIKKYSSDILVGDEASESTPDRKRSQGLKNS